MVAVRRTQHVAVPGRRTPNVGDDDGDVVDLVDQVPKAAALDAGVPMQVFSFFAVAHDIVCRAVLF